MITNQQYADHLLQRWQTLRSLPPEERLQALIDDFFSPLPPCSVEYEATLSRVREEMA